MKNLVLSHVIRMTKLFTYSFLIQFLSMSFLFAWNGNAQVKDIEEVMITLSLENTKIEKAFSSIEKMTGFNFVHTDKELKDVPRVNTYGNDTQSVYALLSIIGQQTGLYFKQVNQNIHVRKGDNIGKRNYPKTENEEFFEIEISGRVTDENGEPLPGATITLENTTSGTVSDIDGNFSIAVNEGTVLVVSFIGYTTKRIRITNQSQIEVTMELDDNSLSV